MAWNAALPTSATSIVLIPSVHSANWEAIEDAFGEEHHTFNTTQEGHHKQGVTPVLSAGADVITSFVAPPGSGCMAWDTRIGQTAVFNGTWKLVGTQFATSRLLVDMTVYGGDFTASAGLQQQLPFMGPGTYNPLSEFVGVDVMGGTQFPGSFRPKEEGFFLVHGQAQVLQSAAGVVTSLSILQYDSDGNDKNTITTKMESPSLDEFSISVQGILHMVRGDYMILVIECEGYDDFTVRGDADETFMTIVRVA